MSPIYGAKIQPGAKVLYFFIKENPGVHSQAELAQLMKTTTQSINAYVKALKDGGWVLVHEITGTRRFHYEVR